MATNTPTTVERVTPGALDPWHLLERVLEQRAARTVYVWGPPGCGKTYGAYHFACEPDAFYAITLTEETSATELRGHYLVRGSETYWHDGPFVAAMRAGLRLVINEIGNASADVLGLLFPVLESWETARISLPTGETVAPAPGFHVIATDNRAPDQLPHALHDRFESFVRVEQPHPDALASLPPEVRAWADIVRGVDDDRRVSVRSWKTLARLLEEFDLEAALHLAFGPERGPLLFDAIRMREAGRAGPRLRRREKPSAAPAVGSRGGAK